MVAMKKLVLCIGYLLGAIIIVAQGDDGFATPNTVYVPSACYGYNNPTDTLTTAVSELLFNDQAGCGKRYTVTCTGATNLGILEPCTGESVTVTVVDLCPSPGCKGTFDLDEEAFSTIADPAAGNIKIEYDEL